MRLTEGQLRRAEKAIDHRKPYEEVKRLRAAAKAKRAERAVSGPEHEPPEENDDVELDDEQWDEVFEIEERGRPRPKRDLHGKKKRPPSQPPGGGAERHEGIVVTIRKKRTRVALGEELVTAWLTSDLASEQKSAIAAGDEVVLEKRGDDWIVAEVLPRRATLSRPDPFDPASERVVAANIDVVVHVSAAKNPPLRAGLIDRYLIAIERGGSRPVVCVNKADLLTQQERIDAEELLLPYVDLGIEIVWCSAEEGTGIDDLRRAVEGKTAVLVGHSGVGKSSLLNALDESLRIATRELHKEGNVGRHTTTSTTLYQFADGTRLIDTPGIREFGLWDIDRISLRFYFPEFGPYALRCRFRDCTHTHEPECAVQEAVESGELSESRYERYVGILEGI
jgi:ribosome biogenesis GTPase / thiamine phosphate phosphatase